MNTIELTATELPAMPVTELLEIIQAQSRRILRDTNIRGAVAALLYEIHCAGGYHVFDPDRQERVDHVIQSLQNAMMEAVNHAN